MTYHPFIALLASLKARVASKPARTWSGVSCGLNNGCVPPVFGQIMTLFSRSNGHGDACVDNASGEQIRKTHSSYMPG